MTLNVVTLDELLKMDLSQLKSTKKLQMEAIKKEIGALLIKYVELEGKYKEGDLTKKPCTVERIIEATNTHIDDHYDSKKCSMTVKTRIHSEWPK
jgi:hypothetical protein